MTDLLPREVEDLRSRGAWFIGDPPVRVYTERGAEYGLSSGGWVAGGGRALRGQMRNKVLGSVEESRGPILIGVVVPGMRMEIHRPTRSILVTSPVTRIEFESDLPNDAGGGGEVRKVPRARGVGDRLALRPVPIPTKGRGA